jgi:DNA topoisomerase-1
MTPKTIDMELAVKLLSLPRDLGLHPESGKMVQANNGKFGPYVMHDGEFRSLKKEDDVYTVELARALEILAMPKFGRGGTVIKDFGKVEKIKKSVKIVDGKYGLYVKAGTKNYSLPDDLKDLEKVKKLTEAQVLKIIADSGK